MNDLLQQGIAAFQAGDRDRAREIFEQIVAAEPQNDNAWYYLAAAQTDFTRRRQYLERALAINPQHQRAREVLERVKQMTPEPSAPPASGPPPGAVPNPGAAPRAEGRPPVRMLGTEADTPGEATSGGFALPFSIPGAPARVGLRELLRDGWALFGVGIAALQNRIGAYEVEVRKASWWRYWLLVTFGALLTAGLTLLGVSVFLLAGRADMILLVLVSVLLTIPLTLIIMYAGVYASYWWMKSKGTTVRLDQHAYATVIPYVTASVLGTLIGAVLNLIGLGNLGDLIGLGLTIYALYIVVQAYERLHRFTNSNNNVIAVVFFFLGSIVAGILLGVVLAVFGLTMLLPVI